MMHWYGQCSPDRQHYCLELFDCHFDVTVVKYLANDRIFVRYLTCDWHVYYVLLLSHDSLLQFFESVDYSGFTFL